MFAIFIIESEAQKLCDKIHEYLTAECPGYNADKWQTPVPCPDLKIKEWYVKLPQEFENDLYEKAKELKPLIKVDTDKSKEVVEKLPDTFKEILVK